MRAARIIFVSLLGVGAVGVVYVGLTAGLAAYLRVQSQAEGGGTDGGADPATQTAVAVEKQVDPMLAPVRMQAGQLPPPPPGMEDAVALHRRTWTAPRAGLAMPPRFADAPAAGKYMLVSATPLTWSPKPEPLGRGRRLLPLDTASPKLPRVRPIAEPPMVSPMLTLAAPTAIALPVAPPARVASEDPSLVRVGATARRREVERPAATDDATSAAGEKVLLRGAAPVRSTPAPAQADRLSIPEPTTTFGDLRTTVEESEMPALSPQRPTAIKLPTKK